jgi:hypothetical protein
MGCTHIARIMSQTFDSANHTPLRIRTDSSWIESRALKPVGAAMRFAR